MMLETKQGQRRREVDEVAMCAHCGACPAETFGGVGGMEDICEPCWTRYERGDYRPHLETGADGSHGGSDTSTAGESGSEGEPDICQCCWAEARTLRTARDCCQSSVCAACIRDTSEGRFCAICFLG